FPRVRERAARDSVLQADNGSASFRLDVRGPDHFCLFLGFVRDELAEVGRRAHERRAAKLVEPRLDLGVGEACVISSLSLPMISVGVWLGAPIETNGLAFGPVLDYDRLPKPLSEPLRDQARGDVGGAAGGKPDEQAYRTARVLRRPHPQGRQAC